MRKLLFLFTLLTFFFSGLKVQASSFPLDSINTFRARTYKNIYQTRLETQKRIDLLENISKSNKNSNLANKKVLDSTEKPIAYVKLLLLSVASFVFSTTVIFYAVLILASFFILRLIYRKLRNK